MSLRLEAVVRLIPPNQSSVVPANSIILSDIAGSTTGNPDGATFLDNLFGSGLSAPSDKLFSLSLARREDVRTASSFGIGAISKALCPQPCNPTYIPIVSQPSLGAVGYLHWRIPLQGIIATTWADQRAGLGATQRNITLGSSQTSSGGSTPLAVLDSGGVQILVGHQPWVDAIYGAYGVQASSDGNCELSVIMLANQDSADNVRPNAMYNPACPLVRVRR